MAGTKKGKDYKDPESSEIRRQFAISSPSFEINSSVKPGAGFYLEEEGQENAAFSQIQDSQYTAPKKGIADTTDLLEYNHIGLYTEAEPGIGMGKQFLNFIKSLFGISHSKSNTTALYSEDVSSHLYDQRPAMVTNIEHSKEKLRISDSLPLAGKIDLYKIIDNIGENQVIEEQGHKATQQQTGASSLRPSSSRGGAADK